MPYSVYNSQLNIFLLYLEFAIMNFWGVMMWLDRITGLSTSCAAPS
jgi:hypothetical protein